MKKDIEINLEPLNKFHDNFLYDLLNNEQVHLYGNLEYLYPENDYKIQSKLERWIRSDTQKHFIININEKAVGIAQIYNVSITNRKCNVGVLLMPDSMGRGVGSRTIKMLVDIAFNRMNINKIEAEVCNENIPSIKMLEKNFFNLEGTLNKSLFINGNYKDLKIFGLLREDYILHSQ